MKVTDVLYYAKIIALDLLQYLSEDLTQESHEFDPITTGNRNWGCMKDDEKKHFSNLVV